MLTVNDQNLTLMLWDLFGQDDFMKIKSSYLLGSSGFILVADGTRKETIMVAKELYQMAIQHAGNIPFILLLNKSDLVDRWEIDDDELEKLEAIGWKIMRTSAKNGSKVEEAFYWIASQMLK